LATSHRQKWVRLADKRREGKDSPPIIALIGSYPRLPPHSFKFAALIVFLPFNEVLPTM
jgi:hypothetical protein